MCSQYMVELRVWGCWMLGRCDTTISGAPTQMTRGRTWWQTRGTLRWAGATGWILVFNRVALGKKRYIVLPHVAS